MIKKLLLFVVLLTTGFVVLFSLIEERNRPGINPTEQTNKSGPSLKNKDVEIRPSGALHIPVQREIQLSAGRTKLVPIYDLHAEDSEPRPNNTQLLKKVLVEFYETDETQPEPRARRTSWMTADRALLQLSQDEEGRVKVAEDKQMEFWVVKLTTAADASVPNAEIAIEHAIAVNDVQELRLWTPNDEVPVRVTSRGPDPFTVNGLGIRAYVPAHRGKKGKVSIHKKGLFRFTIASHPVLVRDTTTLKSRGPLHYEEDMAAGVATVFMQDQVELHGLTTSGRLDRLAGDNTKGLTAPTDLIARGRRLDAVLTRSEKAMVWTRIILRGTPVQVEGNDMRLICERIDVLPDLAGDPYWITASGARPTMYQDQKRVRILATKHIHLIRPVRKHLALLSGYGLPEVAMPKDHGQLVIFEGPATVIAEQERVLATADGGLIATRTKGDNTPMTFFGKGKVHLESPEWIVDGNDGFRLREVPVANTQPPAFHRFLRLGPERAGPAHAYRIERLPSSNTNTKNVERLVTTGTGACHLTLRADRSGDLHLDSKNHDIRVLMGQDRGELQRVADLEVRFDNTRGLQGLIATGPDCPVRYQMEKTGWITGNAAEIHIPAPGVMRLVGKPRTRIYQEKPTRILEGSQILLQRLSEKAALIHCTGDARMRFRQEKAASPSTNQDVELLAEDIRLLPYLETSTSWDSRFAGLPAFAGSLQAYAHRAPYLFANGNVRLIQRDTQEKVIGRGFGEHLVLRFDNTAQAVDGRLTGKGSKLIRIDRKGGTHVAEANLIRFANDPSGEHVDLVYIPGFDPKVTIPSSSPGKSGSTLVICEGDIAIMPDKVLFRGPMEAQGLDADGRLDPGGLNMTAATMVMDRNQKTGDVTNIRAKRDIHFSVHDMEGEADEMWVDLRQTLIIARGHGRPVVLKQANGSVIRAAQVNHNYRTQQTQSWNGRIVQATKPK